nr:MAG TPA: Baseplate wedge protein [Caudoviricetes sp.]
MHPIETPDKTFHDGDGVSELGTILPAWWLNQVQSELLAVLTAAGIQPDKAKPNQVVEALRKIIDEQAGGKGLPVGAVIGFPRAISTPEGYLKADGSTFNQSTYPDLYRVLGGNKLPDMREQSPIGELVMWTMDGALPDYLIDANGQNISRTAYPELFAKWGTRYGAGNGSTTFGVPDWRGEFPRFWDNGRGVDVGRALGSAQADEFKSHTHGGVPQRAGDSDRGGAVSWFSIDGIGQTEAAGGSETRPRNVAVRACIVAKPSDKGINYWVKAYGKVTNAGTLDASTLAADIQRKANRDEVAPKSHTHRSSEITDFSAAVDALSSHQKIGTFDIYKDPGGRMIQAGTVQVLNHNNQMGGRILTWPVSFVDTPHVVLTLSGRDINVVDVFITYDHTRTDKTQVCYWIYENATNKAAEVTVNFVAIGRWK